MWDKVRKRTVGPALATMSTVSPLGTALTVPRSHPVTGMMRERMRTRSFPLKVKFFFVGNVGGNGEWFSCDFF